MTREEVCLSIAGVYERITGRPCRATIFVVRRDSNYGFYLVQILGDSWFYEVLWKVGAPTRCGQ